LLFNAGCNEQVFSPKPEKKLAQIRFVVFEKNAKPTFNSKKWRHTSRRLESLATLITS